MKPRRLIGKKQSWLMKRSGISGRLNCMFIVIAYRWLQSNLHVMTVSLSWALNSARRVTAVCSKVAYEQLYLLPPRSGHPDECPAGRADADESHCCVGCPFNKYTELGTWRCEHPAYQNEPGVHFCRACWRELSPYNVLNGWEFCNVDRCLNV